MKKSRTNRLVAIFSIYFSFVLLAWAVTSDGIVLSDVLEKLGYAGRNEGITSLMKSIGSILALLLIFVLTGRIKKPLLITGTGLVAAVSFFMMGSADVSWLFLAWTLLSGFGEASVDSLMNSYLLDINGTENSIFMNMLHGFYGIGGIIGPIIFSAVYLKQGYRNIYHLAGLLLAIATAQFVVVTVLTGRKRTSEESEAVSEPISGRDILTYIANKRNLVIMLCMIAAQAAQKCVAVWITRYCELELNDFEIGAICISALWVGITVSRFLFPLLKIRLEKSIGWCLILSSAVFLGGMAIGSGKIMLVGTALFGALSGSVIPDIITFAARGYESRSSLPTTIMSLMMFGAGLLLSLFMSAFIRIAGLRAAIAAVMALGVATGVIALLTFSKTPESH